MKRLFYLSLIASVGLLALVGGSRFWRLNPAASPAIGPGHLQPRSTRLPAAATGGALTNSASTKIWAAIESGDLTQFVKNLRDSGCPEKTIRDIITFKICRKHHAQLLEQRRQLLLSAGFTRGISAREWRECQALRVQSSYAMNRELETLLGINGEKLKAQVFGLPAIWDTEDYLPLAALDKVRELDCRYGQLIAEAKQGLSGLDSDSVVDAKIAELNRQKRAELETKLTPQELALYDQNQSAAAQYARGYLPAAQSEAEFKKMVQAVEETGVDLPKPRTFASRYGLSAGDDAESVEQAQKQAQLEAKLKEILGEQRWREMQQAEQTREAEMNNYMRDEEQQKAQAWFVLTAEMMGINADEARQFYDQLMLLRPEWQAKCAEMEKNLAGTTDEKRRQIQAAVQAELIQLAAVTMNGTGAALINRSIRDGGVLNGYPN
jgi:hypothetical protein